jgi:biopolymer transport protein ExbD
VLHNEKGVDMNTLRDEIRALTLANPSLIVSIKTDPGTKYKYFVNVVDQIKRAGNDRISIAGD